MIRPFALFLFSLFTAAALHAGDATTILVVRHAEADQTPEVKDPALTEIGEKRAEALAEVAKDAGVRIVYTTQYRRTKDTAAPLRRTGDIPLAEVAVARETIALQTAELAKKIIEQHKGETVLIVGHSNTVPLFVEALSGVKVPAIAHAEHDRLYVVILEDGEARVIATRY
ncbi:MAG TPA: phosphoglycerate mutase family protein [Thermoanaerobaculia bacterium]